MAWSATPSAGLAGEASMSLLADADDFHVQEAAQPCDPGAHVTQAHGAVVRGTLPAPLVHVGARADGEAVPAVGVADLEHGAGDALALGHEQLQLPISRLHDGEHGDGSLTHRHLRGQPASHLAVEHAEGPDLDAALGDAE